MRILVTGAGGFVGARIAADFADAGHTVTGTWRADRSRLPDDTGGNLSFRKTDLAEAADVDALFETSGPFDAVVHAAAAVASRPEDAAYLVHAARANVGATANVVAAAGRAGCRHFVFTSTISVYGDRGAPSGGYRESDAAPVSWYGWSKVSGERLIEIAAREFGFTAVSLRLAGVHGQGRETGALAGMTDAAIAGRDLVVNEPESRFRWVWIEDVSAAARLACEADWPGKSAVFNLASADSFTLARLARDIIDTAVSTSGIDASGATGRVREETMNIDAAVARLGFAPTPLAGFLPGYIAGRRAG